MRSVAVGLIITHYFPKCPEEVGGGGGGLTLQGTVIRKPINTNPRLKVNQGFRLAL